MTKQFISKTIKIFMLLILLLIFLPYMASSESISLDVPTYDQNNFGHNCNMDCSPTAAAMILGYWDSHGWPRMVPIGSADYNINPSGVTDLVMDLWRTMEYVCSIGTTPSKVPPGIIKTASNMDPGAAFLQHSFNNVFDENKDEVFEQLKGYMSLGWPVLFTAAPGLKLFLPNIGSGDTLREWHSMVMTGYLDTGTNRQIFLNSGVGYPKDKFWVDWDNLGLDLSNTDSPQIWITCVAPAGLASLDIWGVFFFRSNVGLNRLGFGWEGCNPELVSVCDSIGLGCNVDPIISTAVLAKNVDSGYSINLINYGQIIDPYEFARRFAYDPAKTSPWVITATNGPHGAEITTHAIGDVGQTPFLRNVQLTGTGLSPTISWTVPSGTDANRILISVIDSNTGKKLWWSPGIGLENTSFSIPEGVLQTNHPYLIRPIIQKTLSGTISGPDISRAESFFEFTPLNEGGPQTVFLPTVGIDLNTNDEFAASYNFDIDVGIGVPCFIDPFVAIGYDYAIGVDDTVKFASVTLPQAGDDRFDLYLFDGTKFYLAVRNLCSGVKYSFEPEGVDKFRVLGIEEDARLDPLNVTAFITEATFTKTGRFTGKMTPITSYPSTVDIHPYKLNKKSKGNFITAYIELPDCIDVSQIDLKSVSLIVGDSIISAESLTNIGDYDNDGIQDLMVKFNRENVSDILNLGENEIRISGNIFGHKIGFLGLGTILYKDK